MTPHPLSQCRQLKAAMEQMVAPRLGVRVREKYTGIEGVVVAITEWLHRSNEAAVARDGVDHNGAPWDLQWFDTDRLTVIPHEDAGQ